MYDLNLIKQHGGVYIDSREVAEAVGKAHKHLIRDIRGYCAILEKIGKPNLGPTYFFIESTYIDKWNREKPHYLISKMGCELIANKLIGERGVLFTAAYVKKFNEMEAAERAEIEARSATPQLRVFNTAIRNILSGYSGNNATPEEVIDFLRGAYKPFGIDIAHTGDDHYFTATDIAGLSGIFSETGRPHGHAVSAIINKLNIPPEHMIVVPYGLVGVNMRYDYYVLEEVRDWIADNGCPSDIPHHNFKYHIYYDPTWSFLYEYDDSYEEGEDDYFVCEI